MIFNTLVNTPVKPNANVNDNTAWEKSPFSFCKKSIKVITANGTIIITTCKTKNFLSSYFLKLKN